MDDSRLNELRLLHRDLAAHLKEQHQVINNNTIAIAAIRKVLETRPDLQKSYKESLRDLKDDATIQPTPSYTHVFERLLKRLSEW